MSFTNTDDDETAYLAETALENGFSFVKEFKYWENDIGKFLHRETYIPVRSTSVDSYEQTLCFSIKKDIDGAVIEWHNISGISTMVSHFQVIPKGHSALRNMYGILKKHVDLRSYTDASLQSLRSSLGFQLFRGADGWETWLGFVPKCTLSVAYDIDVMKLCALAALNNFKLLVQKKLRENTGNCLVKNTLAKNNLLDISKLRILPDDQDVILKVIDRCLNEMEISTHGIEKILVSFRFGDKCRRQFKFPIGKNEEVKKITVHVGVDVSASIPAADVLATSMFWSKQGLQEIVGQRGTLTTAYGFTECGNFQSNLDGRMLDISRDLRSVCVCANSLNFVQLYADTPHRYPDCRFHPVSAAIIMIDGIAKTRIHLDTDARNYIFEMRNNFEQLSESTCRIEFVTVLPDVTDVIEAEDLINEKQLCNLFESHPLFVPFCHDEFSSCLQSVGLYLVKGLENAYLANKGTGRSKSVWDAYQFELAVEKLLYGRPLCSISRIYSINLGPGVGYPSRSKSDSSGFLGLEDSFACCEDESSHPPLAIFSKSEIVKRQLQKTFGALDLTHSSKSVLGRRLMLILLNDLYDVGRVYNSFNEFLGSLKLNNSTGVRQRVVGGMTAKALTDLVVSTKKGKYPMVICALLRILQKDVVDVSESLRSGIGELDLGYFPAFRTYDGQRNEGLYWNWSFGVWVLLDLEKCQDNSQQLANFLAPAVVSNLETLKLCHSSTLRDRNLPWLAPCISKLSEIKMGNDELINVLTFITSIARIMGGMYVSFPNLRRLTMNLPKSITQRKLQTLEIQSKYLLNNFNMFRLWRLHHSIPWKMEDKSSVKPNSTPTINEHQLPTEPHETDMEELVTRHCIKTAVEEEEVVHWTIQSVQIRHLPTNCFKRWTPTELALVAEVKDKYSDMSLKYRYEEYQKLCRDMGIPDRSMDSFKRKLYKI